jgi:hypothetical protein
MCMCVCVDRCCMCVCVDRCCMCVCRGVCVYVCVGVFMYRLMCIECLVCVRSSDLKYSVL